MAFPQAQQQVIADRAAELARHQAAVLSAARNGLLGQPNSPLILLADGDSWFNYPLDDAGRWGMGLKYFGIIDQLNSLPSQPLICNLAHWGDASTTAMGSSRCQQIIDTVNNEANGSFDGILFSGGGDDLVGDQFCIWLNQAASVGNDPQQAFNAAFSLILQIVQTSYSQLIQLRDSLSRLGKNIPIFVHGYDFALPTNVGVCNQGPWLTPSLVYRGWMAAGDTNQGAPIVKAALLQFANMLQNSFKNQNLIYIQTQGTLAVSDWANELHPNAAGWRKLADKFQVALASQFHGRI